MRARARDTMLGNHLRACEDLISHQSRQLAQLDAERAQLATTVRSALDAEHASLAATLEAQRAHLSRTLRTSRLMVILGLALVFTETLAPSFCESSYRRFGLAGGVPARFGFGKAGAATALCHHCQVK